jgi:glycosyltransferase involved in cell wall biosynthesis
LDTDFCVNTTQDQISRGDPFFSVVVCLFNEWAMIDGCLQALGRQENAPIFEVIIVDDGSSETAPDFIAKSSHGYPLTLVRQVHAGIPSARNRGTLAAKGEVLVFFDADSRPDPNCLSALRSAIGRSPQHDCFQLRLTGHLSTLVGRAEQLRLLSFQKHTLQPDGRIRYLNTAGFAIRRVRANASGVFDPRALRGEDTLLLASLMQAGELPLFVPDAIVEHYVQLSLAECIRKDFQSASQEARTFRMIASTGVEIRVTFRERLKLLRSTWNIARERTIGRSAWFVLIIRQAVQRVLFYGYRYLR